MSFRNWLKASFIEGFSIIALWVGNAHCTFLESLEVITKIIRQAIVIDLTSTFGHWSYTCTVELSQFFAKYFGAFKLSRKVQPRCCFLYDFRDVNDPFKIAS